MLTDDLSDYSTSDDEIEKNLRGVEREGEGDEEEKGFQHFAGAIGKRKMIIRNKYQRTLSIREQWTDYASKSCSENNL
jgi:hypothetical protein